jgi:hypothetical protein
LHRAGSQIITEADFAEIIERELRPRHRSIQETVARLKPAESKMASPAFLSLLEYHEKLPAAWEQWMASIEGRTSIKQSSTEVRGITERYEKVLREHEQGRTSDQELARIIEVELLPGCRSILERAARTRPADSRQAELLRKLEQTTENLKRYLHQEVERLKTKAEGEKS